MPTIDVGGKRCVEVGAYASWLWRTSLNIQHKDLPINHTLDRLKAVILSYRGRRRAASTLIGPAGEILPELISVDLEGYTLLVSSRLHPVVMEATQANISWLIMSLRRDLLEGVPVPVRALVLPDQSDDSDDDEETRSMEDILYHRGWWAAAPHFNPKGLSIKFAPDLQPPRTQGRDRDRPPGPGDVIEMQIVDAVVQVQEFFH